MSGDALNVELVATRPGYLVFRFAVGAQRNTFHWFRQPCRSHHTHPFLTHCTSKDFLHVSSSRRKLISGGVRARYSRSKLLSNARQALRPDAIRAAALHVCRAPRAQSSCGKSDRAASDLCPRDTLFQSLSSRRLLRAWWPRAAHGPPPVAR